jgi:hypothetical protein
MLRISQDHKPNDAKKLRSQSCDGRDGVGAKRTAADLLSNAILRSASQRVTGIAASATMKPDHESLFIGAFP